MWRGSRDWLPWLIAAGLVVLGGWCWLMRLLAEV
jgi:hypothetical protein